MARVLFAFLVLVPIVELAILIAVGQAIGIWWTLLLLLGSAVLGLYLLRQQGLSILTRMRTSMSRREVPAREVAETMMIGLAAILLVIPGLGSDVIALTLLVPPVRRALYGGLARNVVVVNSGPGGAAGARPENPAARNNAARPGRPPDPGQVRGPGTIDLDEDDYRRQ